MGGPPAKDGKKQSVGMSLVKGTITGFVEAVICYPTEFVKTQLQLQSKSNPGGFVAGLLVAIVRVVVSNMYIAT